MRLVRVGRWPRRCELILPEPADMTVNEWGRLMAAGGNISLAFSGRRRRNTRQAALWLVEAADHLPERGRSGNVDPLALPTMMREYGQTWQQLNDTPIWLLRRMSDQLPRLLARDSLNAIGDSIAAPDRLDYLWRMAAETSNQTEQEALDLFFA